MSHTIAGITMPDSQMARDLTQMIRDTEADLLFHHSTRVYLFGALTGQRKGLTYDAKLIWQLASPQWDFDEATFDRSAASFDNLDHVSIVIHNYRWRLSLAAGEPPYDALEQRLAQGPVIAVPTITLEGDANGAPHPDARAYAKQCSGAYAHRVITGGVGHNLPQEAPQAFAKAVVDVDGY